MAGVDSVSENVPSPLSGCSVLLVVGEPFCREHKDLILEQITKGFLSWDTDATGCDIGGVLERIADAAPNGEEGEFGDVTIKSAEEGCVVTILANPIVSGVKDSLRDLLVTPSKHKHVIFAGHSFQGTGAWILQDDTFSVQNMIQVFKESDVDNAIKQQSGSTLSLHCPAEGDWNSALLSKQDFAKHIAISINPTAVGEPSEAINQFTSFMSFFIKAKPSHELMQASDVVGNIRFSKPTMYVFPGSQGDSALFGVSGFSLLIDGGYQRKPCFWDFARHLDRIDALLVTHMNGDNLFGVANALNRKLENSIHPEIGHVFFNTSQKAKHSPNGDLHPEAGGLMKDSSQLVNLVECGDKLIENLHALGLPPQPCTRSMTDGQHPINLYHKVGHGRLDMFVLNPVQDSKELKDFFQQWNKRVTSFTSVNQIPLPNVTSVSALLVWRPADPREKITRILFPGAAPQAKIFEGLDKIKNLDCLKHATCCDNDFHIKHPTKKPASKVSKPMAKPTPQVVVVQDKPARSKPSARPEKTTKDVANKKSTSAKEQAPKSRFERSKTPSPPVRSPILTPVHAGTPTPEVKEEPAALLVTPVASAPEEPALMDETPRLASDEAPTPPVASPEPPAARPESPAASSESPAASPEPHVVEPPPAEPVDVYPPSVDNIGPDVTQEADEQADLMGDFEAPTPPAKDEPPAEPFMASEPPMDATAESSVAPSVEDEPEPLHEPPTEDLLGGYAGEPKPDDESVPAPSEAWPLEAATAADHIPEALPEPHAIDPSMLEPAPVVPDYVTEGYEKHYEEEKDVDTAAVEENAEEPDVGGVGDAGISVMSNVTACPDIDNAAVQEMPESSLQSKSQLEELGIYDDDEGNEEYPEDGAEDQHLASGYDAKEAGHAEDEDVDLEALTQISNEDIMQRSMYSEEPLPVSEPTDVTSLAERNVRDEPVPMDIDTSGEWGESDKVAEQELPVDTEADDLTTVCTRDNPPDLLSRPDSSDGCDDVSSLHVEPSQSELDFGKVDEDVAEAERHRRESGGESNDVDDIDDDYREEDEAADGDVNGGAYDNQAFSVGDDGQEDPSLQKPELSPPSGEQKVDGEPNGVDLLSDSPGDAQTPVNETGEAQPDLFAHFDAPPEQAAVKQKSTNPFEADFDPFAPSSQALQPESTEDLPAQPGEFGLQSEASGVQSFDPLRDWGEPLGLPAPPPPPEAKDNKTAAKKPSAKSTTTRKTTTTTTASRTKVTEKTKTESPKKSPSPAKSTSSASSRTKPTASAATKARSSPLLAAKNGPAGDGKKADAVKQTKPRPATADRTSRQDEKKPLSSRVQSRSAATSRKTTTGSKTNVSGKAPPALAPVTPSYVDLTYVPYHANPKYSDLDFFRRVRARYYVVSSLHPSPTVLNNLVEAKQTWEDKNLEVTIIPTYDTDTLRHWMGLHRDRLSELKIDVAPSASRCTIQLQDHETSCSAYRLEF